MPPRRSDRLSLAEARRIALAAQGFGAPRAQEEAGKRDLRRVFERLGVVQINSVNVLARAHTLPAFSRLGRYRTADLHALAYGGRKRVLFEYWGHEASLLPVALQPLLRWRMARAERGEGIYGAIARFGREHRELIDAGAPRDPRAWTSGGRRAVAPAQGRGRLVGMVGGQARSRVAVLVRRGDDGARRGTFERVYGLTEHVLPRSIETPTPDEADAQRELLRISARSLGVATERCLRDYFRLGPADAGHASPNWSKRASSFQRPCEGWDRIAYLTGRPGGRGAWRRRRSGAPRSLIWQRERIEALFGARIRLELYTPREKRTHGYYVLPFLLGDRIVARVDLKADRAVSVLRVQAAHAEAGVAMRRSRRSRSRPSCT